MPLKILVLTNLFPSAWDPARSAFNRQQFECLAALPETTVRVMTAVDMRSRFAGQRGDPELRHVEARNFVFVYPPRIGRRWHPWFWRQSLLAQHRRWLRASDFDCVLGSWAFPDGVAAAWIADWLGLPYAIKVHGSDLNVAASLPAQGKQIGAALAGAGAVVSVSKALAGKAVALGADPARVEVLYNGVDAERFRPGDQAAARVRLGLDPGAQLVIGVGNIKRSKGSLDLVDGLAALHRTRPGARLALLGDGPDRSLVAQRIAALGLGDAVQMVGQVAHDALPDWYRAADVMCLPSHNEGVPNVVLEAMASGTPVVASRVGGIPEVVPGFAGVLVPPHDTEALAAALDQVLARTWDPDRMVAYAGEFRWDTNVRRLRAILAGLADSSSAGPE